MELSEKNLCTASSMDVHRVCPRKTTFGFGLWIYPAAHQLLASKRFCKRPGIGCGVLPIQ